MAELHDSFWARDISQRMSSQIGQPCTGGQLFEHQLLGDTGQHGLAPVRQVPQPCRAIDGGADVVCFVS